MTTGEYRFEYCQEDAAINDITLDNLTLDTGYPAGTFFTWYNADGLGNINYGSPITIASAKDVTATAEELILPLNPTALTPGALAPNEYIFFVEQTSYMGEGNFASGCVSTPRKIVVDVTATPSSPAIALGASLKTSYYTCQGDDVENLTATAATGVSYTWYFDSNDNGVFDATDDFVAKANSITSAQLAAKGFDKNDPGTHRVWLTRTEGENAETGFNGCEGPETTIEITVYPDYQQPVIGSNANHGALPAVNVGGIDLFEFKYCTDEVTSDIQFVVQNSYSSADAKTKYNCTASQMPPPP